jgi:hypothetical protein
MERERAEGATLRAAVQWNNRIDLDQEIGMGQRCDDQERVGRSRVGEELGPHVSHRSSILEVGQVDGGSGNVGHRPSGSFDDPLHIQQDLSSLGGGVAVANQLALFVEGHLAGDEQNPASGDYSV